MSSMTEFEIVAFDGKVRAPTGRTLPIAFNPVTKKYFVLEGDSSPMMSPVTWDGGEYLEWQAQGRLTRLARSVTAFPNAMIVYLRSDTEEALGGLPKSVNAEPLSWQLLATETKAWATCLPDSVAIQLLDDLAFSLLEKTSTALSNFFRDNDLRESKKALVLSKIALSSARLRSLRESIYLRYGLALRHTKLPESLSNIHRLIEREIPSWKWETFLNQMQHVKDELTIKSTLILNVKPTPELAGEVFIQQVKCVAQLPTFEEKFAAACRYADEVTIDPVGYNQSLSEVRDELTQRARPNQRVLLPLSVIDFFRTEPLCYLSRVIQIPETGRIHLSLFSFWDALEEFEKSGFKSDSLTEVGRMLAETD